MTTRCGSEEEQHGTLNHWGQMLNKYHGERHSFVPWALKLHALSSELDALSSLPRYLKDNFEKKKPPNHSYTFYL